MGLTNVVLPRFPAVSYFGYLRRSIPVQRAHPFRILRLDVSAVEDHRVSCVLASAELCGRTWCEAQFLPRIIGNLC